MILSVSLFLLKKTGHPVHRSRGTAGPEWEVWLWTPWSIPTVVVTISILALPVPSSGLPPLVERSVSSPPAELVSSEVDARRGSPRKSERPPKNSLPIWFLELLMIMKLFIIVCSWFFFQIVFMMLLSRVEMSYVNLVKERMIMISWSYCNLTDCYL